MYACRVVHVLFARVNLCRSVLVFLVELFTRVACGRTLLFGTACCLSLLFLLSPFGIVTAGVKEATCPPPLPAQSPIAPFQKAIWFIAAAEYYWFDSLSTHPGGDH